MAGPKEFATLLYEQAGPVAVVTLHRPEALNALNAGMFNDLERAFSMLASDAEVRVVLLTGSGERAFAAGADIRELVQTDSASGRAVSERGQEVFSQIEHCGKPVIACVNGVALGGGCELALACTFRLASERAQFGLPETKLGLIPGYGGTQRMPRLIGQAAALRLMLTGLSVNASEALRLGLVEEVVPAADLMSTARRIAEAIAQKAPLAVSAVLRAVHQGEDESMERGLQGETAIFGDLCGTADKQEGLAAFLEKRAAVWQGK